MPTNLAIDDNLLNEALRIGGRRTKRETVNEALKEYVERRKRDRDRALDWLGTFDFDPRYDYKRERRRR
jgi:Arc/MetJ family transcription regulator